MHQLRRARIHDPPKTFKKSSSSLPISPCAPLQTWFDNDLEIERRSQEGEDISVLDNVGPVTYSRRKTANTRPADAALIQRAKRFPKKLLRRESGVSQHAIERFLDGERIHPTTRKKVAETVDKLERRVSLL